MPNLRSDQPSDMSKIEAILRRAPVIPVLTLKTVEAAAPLARCLVDHGLPVLEVTLRTPAATEAIAAMRAACTEAIVGAGTILDSADLDRASAAGAAFIVSPGFDPSLAEAVLARGIPYLPGVATAGEIMAARRAGFRALKLFPADVAGGLGALRAFAPVFRDVIFCPTGGIKAETAASFLALPNVACVGGSWIAPAELVDAGRFDEIGALAANAARMHRSV